MCRLRDGMERIARRAAGLVHMPMVQGGDIAMAKRLDEKTRAEIRLALSEGMKQKDAARYYGVSQNTISVIKRELEPVVEIYEGTENMQMSPEEICSSYRTAKDRAGQVRILAELNATSEAEIAKILLADPTTGFAAAVNSAGAAKAAPKKAAEAPEKAKAPEKARDTADAIVRCSEALFGALKALTGAGADAAEVNMKVSGFEIRASMERTV